MLEFSDGTLLHVQPSPTLLYADSPSQLLDWLLYCVGRLWIVPRNRYLRCAAYLFAQLRHSLRDAPLLFSSGQSSGTFEESNILRSENRSTLLKFGFVIFLE